MIDSDACSSWLDVRESFIGRDLDGMVNEEKGSISSSFMIVWYLSEDEMSKIERQGEADKREQNEFSMIASRERKSQGIEGNMKR